MPSQRRILLQWARDVSTVGNSLQLLGDVILIVITAGRGCQYSVYGMLVQRVADVSTKLRNVITSGRGCQYRITKCYYFW